MFIPNMTTFPPPRQGQRHSSTASKNITILNSLEMSGHHRYCGSIGPCRIPPSPTPRKRQGSLFTELHDNPNPLSAGKMNALAVPWWGGETWGVTGPLGAPLRGFLSLSHSAQRLTCALNRVNQQTREPMQQSQSAELTNFSLKEDRVKTVKKL